MYAARTIRTGATARAIGFTIPRPRAIAAPYAAERRKSVSQRRRIKCIVAAYMGSGTFQPDLFPIIVDCDDREFEFQDHHIAATYAAEGAGFETNTMIVFDETDKAGQAMAQLFDWDSVPVVTVAEILYQT